MITTLAKVCNGSQADVVWTLGSRHNFLVHGQKKRRKRTLGGTLTVNGEALTWELLSEPQWSNSGDGYIGMRIGVRAVEAVTRELVIEYPYPIDRQGAPKPVPQRPEVSQPMVQRSIEEAFDAGWDPRSRGKAFLLRAGTSA